MYADFVEAFDGIDNGVAQYITTEPPRYRSRTDISARVGALNPRWNEPSTDEVLLERFERASKMCGQEFLDRLDYLHKAWLPARDIVVRAVEKRKDVHPSGKVIVFDEFCPWKVRPVANITLPIFPSPGRPLNPRPTSRPRRWRMPAGAPPRPRGRALDPGRRAPAVRPLPGERSARLQVARPGRRCLARVVRQPQGPP